jgi:hypothetical protein
MAPNAVVSTSVFTSSLPGDCLTTNSLLQLTNCQAGDRLRPTCSSHRRLKTPSKVIVTLRLTVSQSVSQSVSLGVDPYFGITTRYYLLFDSYSLVNVGRPLTRGRVCLLSVIVCSNLSFVIV